MSTAVLENPVESFAQRVAEALELMAFIIAEPAAEHRDLELPAFVTSVNFFGAANGTVEMICPLALGHLLMANVELTRPADADQLAAEALCELTNISCGSFVAQAFKSLGTTTLGLPQQRVASADDAAAWHDAVALDADGVQILVRVTMEGAQ